ncbi:MAG: signal peptidase I [Clostridia bacterium]|nr:signal peptidase I [Clostridia bacterium]
MKYSSDIKEIKEFSLAKSVMYNFVLSIFISLALGVVLVYALNIRLDRVISPSMAPAIYKHDIVIVKPCDDYKVGDIIEYQRTAEAKPVTHRIVEKTGSGANAVYVTQGDATSNKDASVSHSIIKGKVIMIIRNGEHIYDFIKENYFLFIDIILGVWVLSSTLSGEIEMRKHNIAKAE